MLDAISETYSSQSIGGIAWLDVKGYLIESHGISTQSGNHNGKS